MTRMIVVGAVVIGPLGINNVGGARVIGAVALGVVVTTAGGCGAADVGGVLSATVEVSADVSVGSAELVAMTGATDGLGVRVRSIGAIGSAGWTTLSRHTIAPMISASRHAPSSHR